MKVDKISIVGMGRGGSFMFKVGGAVESKFENASLVSGTGSMTSLVGYPNVAGHDDNLKR